MHPLYQSRLRQYTLYINLPYALSIVSWVFFVRVYANNNLVAYTCRSGVAVTFNAHAYVHTTCPASRVSCTKVWWRQHLRVPFTWVFFVNWCVRTARTSTAGDTCIAIGRRHRFSSVYLQFILLLSIVRNICMLAPEALLHDIWRHHTGVLTRYTRFQIFLLTRHASL